MKRIIYLLGLTLVLSSNASFTEVLNSSSSATDACGVQLAAFVHSMNNLSQTSFCELSAIMQNTSTTDAEKWAAVANNSNLNGFYNVTNSTISVLNANGYSSMSESDRTLVNNKLLEELGIADIKPECIGYSDAVDRVLTANELCLAAAWQLSMPNLVMLAVRLAWCDAQLIAMAYKLRQDYPGCGGWVAFVPKNYIIDFASENTNCDY